MYIINKVKGILNRIAVNKCYNIYISYSSWLLDLSHLPLKFPCRGPERKIGGENGHGEKCKVFLHCSKSPGLYDTRFALLSARIRDQACKERHLGQFTRFKFWKSNNVFWIVINVFPPFNTVQVFKKMCFPSLIRGITALKFPWSSAFSSELNTIYLPGYSLINLFILHR